jgi:hypothetical protein
MAMALGVALGHTRIMPSRDKEDDQRSSKAARLSHHYGRCPKCELIVPLSCNPPAESDGAGLRMKPAGETRCWLCTRAFDVSEQWPLNFQHPCSDCGTVIRAPADAAVVTCPGCDSYFFNPNNPPAIRQRVEAALAERARIAKLIEELDRRLAEAQTHSDFLQWEESLGFVPHPDCAQQAAGLYGTVGPCMLPLGHTGACSMYTVREAPRKYGPVRVPEEWIDRSRPLPEMFVDAFTEAVRSIAGPREQRVVALRYGLDGKPGRTFRQIGEELGRSPSRARELLVRALLRVRLAPLRPDPKWPAQHRACGVVVHLATEVLGEATDAGAPARVRAFVDQALPNVRLQVATQLLVELACLDLDVLRGGRDRALCRAVAAVRSA